MGPDEPARHPRSSIEDIHQACGRIGADLYLFMAPDAKRWAKALSLREPRSAFEFLALLREDDVTCICDRLAERFGQLGMPIVAVTSFIPEISHAYNEEMCDSAVRNLMLFALGIGNLQANCPILQLVCGSVFRKVRIDRGNVILQTNKVSDSLRMCLDRISRCKASVLESPRWPIDKLRLACELEPGSLNNLGDRDRLALMNNLIDNHQDALIRRTVGFNLDIAHWWLLGHTVDSWISFFKKNPSLEEKIFHAHIAGHSPRGHFGDMSLKRMNDQSKSELKWWLARLAANAPNASGYVSLEYEAARDTILVIESIAELMEWLQEINGGR